MRGLLVTLTPKGAFDHLEDLGAAYVAGFLNDKGIDCRFLQLTDGLFQAERCAKSKFDFVIFTLYNVTRKKVYDACEKIKRESPDTVLVVGGADATVNRKMILEECQYIDYLVKGEGELTTYELIQTLQGEGCLKEIKGLIFREGEAIIENEDRPLVDDITTLSWPNRDYLVDRKLTVASIATSRGCKGNCSFCMTHDIWPIWRGRAVEDVIDEIKFLHDKYEVDCINFVDASFEDPDKDCKRMNEILDGILGLDFKLYFSTDFRAEFISKCNEETLQKLIDAGLSRVVVGIEAANEQDLRLYAKRATLQQNYAISEFFTNAHIPYYPAIINFNAYSTPETIEENIKFFERFKLGGRITLFATELSAFKGSRIYEKIKKDGLLDSENGEYHYQNQNVKELLIFIENEIERLNHNGMHVIQEIDSNLEKADILCYVLRKRMIALREDDKEMIDEVFQSFYEVFNEIRDILNTECVAWYRSLLACAVREDYEAFYEVTKACNIEQTIIECSQRLRKNMLRLFKSLAKKGYMLNIKF